MKRFALVLCLLSLFALCASAGPLIIKSGGGSAGVQYNTGVTNSTLANDGVAPTWPVPGSGSANIVLNPSYVPTWAQLPGTDWISFTNDYNPTPGGGGNNEDLAGGCQTGVAPYTICNGDYVDFYHTFSLGSGGFAGSFLKVLADDTASVWLVNSLGTTQLFSANTSLNASDYDTCSDTPVGCLNSKMGVSATAFSGALQANATNVLVFRVFQRAGDGFGLNYYAEIVPEPGFYGALALGLSGLYLAVRRKRQS